MIALDTNLLVYAHREDAAHHERALGAVRRAASGRGGCAIPWPCVHEFLAVTTHPRIYRPPTPPDDALRAITALTNHPGVHLIGEARDHLQVLDELISRGAVTGPRIHDARIAAICLAHGVDALWSADRDFPGSPACAWSIRWRTEIRFRRDEADVWIEGHDDRCH